MIVTPFDSVKSSTLNNDDLLHVSNPHSRLTSAKNNKKLHISFQNLVLNEAWEERHVSTGANGEKVHY